MQTSPHLPESQDAPLKSGLLGRNPHSTAVGTSHGRSHLLPGSADRVAGCAAVVGGNSFTLSHGKNSDTPISGLWHRRLEKHMQSNLLSSVRFHLAGPGPCCSHTGDFWGEQGPRPTQMYGMLLAGVSLLENGHALLETLSLTQGMKQTQSLGLSSGQWVQQSRCPSFAGRVHHPSGLMRSECFFHLEAHLLTMTGLTHRRTTAYSEWSPGPEGGPPESASWGLWWVGGGECLAEP